MTTRSRIQMLGVWSAVIFIVMWAVGFGAIARWIPPLSPMANALEISALFQEQSVSIRIGMTFMIIGSIFYLPWTILLSDLIREIEGTSFFLSGTQIAAGILSQITFFLPAYFWASAAFRPERASEITQAMVDTGWLLFITPVAPFILQYSILAMFIFLDNRRVPAFPRWAAFLQIWVSISFLPALLAFFLKKGVFAWDGLFVWWVPLVLFVAWFIVMIVLTRAAVLLQDGRRYEVRI